MAGKIIRYLKLFLLFVRMNYMQAMEYRLDFFTSLLPTGAYSLGFLLFVGTIFSKIPTIAGWTFDQLLALFAIEQCLYYLSWILFRHSLEAFSESIRTGSFDLFAKTPINTRFFISFHRQVPGSILSFIGAVVIFIYAMRGVPIVPVNILLFMLFLICGLILLYNLLFSLAVISFWSTESSELIDLADEIFSFGRYPIQIFPTPIAIFLMIIIPALLMSYVPATAFIGILDWRLGALSVIMVFVTWFISEKVWQAGLRHYSSASS